MQRRWRQRPSTRHRAAFDGEFVLPLAAAHGGATHRASCPCSAGRRSDVGCMCRDPERRRLPRAAAPAPSLLLPAPTEGRGTTAGHVRVRATERRATLAFTLRRQVSARSDRIISDARRGHRCSTCFRHCSQHGRYTRIAEAAVGIGARRTAAGTESTNGTAAAAQRRQISPSTRSPLVRVGEPIADELSLMASSMLMLTAMAPVAASAPARSWRFAKHTAAALDRTRHRERIAPWAKVVEGAASAWSACGCSVGAGVEASIQSRRDDDSSRSSRVALLLLSNSGGHLTAQIGNQSTAGQQRQQQRQQASKAHTSNEKAINGGLS